MFKPNKLLLFLLTPFVLIFNPYGFAEETVTITTYYPSPYGIYSSLETDKLGVGDNSGDGNFTSADVPTTAGDAWIKGNVGIGTGTAGPQGVLHIKKNVVGGQFPPIIVDSQSGSYIFRVGGLGKVAINGGSVSSPQSWLYINLQNSVGDTGPAVRIENGASPFFAIENNGRVGIGTASPTYQLQLSTDSAGKPNGGSWANSSDSRLKENIKDIDNPLELMLKLHGRQFAWVNPEEHGNLKHPRFGFIAQEAEGIFPDWVSETEPEGKDRELVKNEKVKSMSIFGFEALTVEAIRQLKAENDTLKERIKVLEEKIK